MDDLGAIVAVDAGTSVEVLDVTDALLDPASLTPKFLLPRIVVARVGGLKIKGSIISSKQVKQRFIFSKIKYFIKDHHGQIVSGLIMGLHVAFISFDAMRKCQKYETKDSFIIYNLLPHTP